MKRQKVINKGYTLSVESWENDGDNTKIKSFTFESLDLALAVAHMCKNLFASSNNGEGGIGNLMDDEIVEAEEIILEYLERNPELWNLQNANPGTDEEKINMVMKFNHYLMGGSEYYYSRVFEKSTLTYSPEDIYLEEIEIK